MQLLPTYTQTNDAHIHKDTKSLAHTLVRLHPEVHASQCHENQHHIQGLQHLMPAGATFRRYQQEICFNNNTDREEDGFHTMLSHYYKL